MTRTPEARLLEMIKGRPSPKGSLKRWGLAWRRHPFAPPSLVWDLVTLNRVLLGALAALSLTWAAKAVTGSFYGLRARVGEAGGLSQTAPSGSGDGSAVRLKDLAARSPFRSLVQAPPPPKAVEVPSAPPEPRIPLSQRASHLSLVGILPGPPVQAVIEDKRQGTTSYVAVGERMGELSIQKISSDRVTLSFENETLDLPL